MDLKLSFKGEIIPIICYLCYFFSIFPASLLLDNFVSQLRTEENQYCKAVYLHVLPTNTAAISFYEKQNFKFHRVLWNYYNINDRKMDGYCYAMYLNGGEPPWTILYPFSPYFP